MSSKETLMMSTVARLADPFHQAVIHEPGN